MNEQKPPESAENPRRWESPPSLMVARGAIVGYLLVLIANAAVAYSWIPWAYWAPGVPHLVVRLSGLLLLLFAIRRGVKGVRIVLWIAAWLMLFFCLSAAFMLLATTLRPEYIEWRRYPGLDRTFMVVSALMTIVTFIGLVHKATRKYLFQTEESSGTDRSLVVGEDQMMTEPVSEATISFRDLEADDPSWIFLRRFKDRIALCISLESDGDLETVMKLETAEELSKALDEMLDREV